MTETSLHNTPAEGAKTERPPESVQAPDPRKGMEDSTIEEAEFRKRFLSQFTDPAFDALKAELDKVVAAAWDGYSNHRKSPRTQKAGPGFTDPNYDMAVDWIAAKAAIDRAQAEHDT